MSDNFVCEKCGCSFPKKGANVSGYEGGANGLHVHCPKCGAVAAQYVKLKEVTHTAGDVRPTLNARRKLGELRINPKLPDKRATFLTRHVKLSICTGELTKF